MSRTCGMFSSTTGSSVSRAAAIAGKAAFFAPLTRMLPSSGLPPRMTSLSIPYESMTILSAYADEQQALVVVLLVGRERVVDLARDCGESLRTVVADNGGKAIEAEFRAGLVGCLHDAIGSYQQH